MTENDIKLCKDILKVFDKAKFDVTGPDLVQVATQLTNFARMVMKHESELKSKVDEKNKVEAGEKL